MSIEGLMLIFVKNNAVFELFCQLAWPVKMGVGVHLHVAFLRLTCFVMDNWPKFKPKICRQPQAFKAAYRDSCHDP
jgi:hypothetical protein